MRSPTTTRSLPTGSMIVTVSSRRPPGAIAGSSISVVLQSREIRMNGEPIHIQPSMTLRARVSPDRSLLWIPSDAAKRFAVNRLRPLIFDLSITVVFDIEGEVTGRIARHVKFDRRHLISGIQMIAAHAEGFAKRPGISRREQLFKLAVGSADLPRPPRCSDQSSPTRGSTCASTLHSSRFRWTSATRNSKVADLAVLSSGDSFGVRRLEAMTLTAVLELGSYLIR